MLSRYWQFSLLILMILASSCSQKSVHQQTTVPSTPPVERNSIMNDKIQKTDAEWKAELTPKQYYILREKGTERAFTGKYWNTKTPGIYVCAGCGQPLFQSETKYNSGCGWPSFYQPVDGKSIEERLDPVGFYGPRTEVVCSRCGGHLGHVFKDGPPPTGLRYCINSEALKLIETDTSKP